MSIQQDRQPPGKGEHALARLASGSSRRPALDVILQSDRDRRTLDWLIEQAGAAAVTEACSKLEGRRPYVSNLAKALGLKPPRLLELPTREEVSRHLAEIRSRLARSRVR